MSLVITFSGSVNDIDLRRLHGEFGIAASKKGIDLGELCYGRDKKTGEVVFNFGGGFESDQSQAEQFIKSAILNSNTSGLAKDTGKVFKSNGVQKLECDPYVTGLNASGDAHSVIVTDLPEASR